ncbi:acyl-[acyl-carrier-protein] thioesterase [Flammeovirga kamogawensis]|uniref:Acyl-[acyl-carrier-protein] thioesterase n=1 Tax=Flammeovirga kamogawensis TaxID=373891 RepID=A0ABX8GWK1_9BACT|nr:acyl-ACP thioesterase domain-containing protein [Flammeovirga kamogawensis]MBB6461137.1 acyl-ACP thioesterase [Flammeovirga kamogawensis]QWG07703.1 hypothetical protein KM029_01835 [Flammeovirga kamogawensis]TRX69511.1 hypothetical protein EO216_15770 [Flammeovirga kamogawensis]
MIENKEGVWEEEQIVTSYQIGPNYTLKPTSISELFQEAAGNHSNAEQFGLREMMAIGKAWVLGSYKYRVKRWPKWTEKLLMQTWVHDVQKFSSQRNFQLVDVKGNIIIQGTSNWFGLDMKKRRPTPIEEFVDRITPRADISCISSPSRLKGIERVDFSLKKKAMYSDLDPVNHVNNIKYFEWMLDSLPHTYKTEKMLTDVEINYVTEVVLDEEVNVVSEVTEEEGVTKVITCIMKQEGVKPACIIHTNWK